MPQATYKDGRSAPLMMAGLAAAAAVIAIHFAARATDSAIADIVSKPVACIAAIAFCVLIGIFPGTTGDAIRNGIYTTLRWMLGILMVILVIPVTLQILSRYTSLIPRYIWTDEIARFSFIWVVMVGAMIGVKESIHFDVDLLPTPKTVQGKGWLRAIVNVSVLSIAFTFVFYGYDFAESAVYQVSEISEMPMILIYGAWPLAGLTWIIFLSTRLYDDILRIRSIEPYPDGEEVITLEVKVKLEEVM